MVKRKRYLKSETELTDRLRRLAVVPRGSGVVTGIGDDCAIFRHRNGLEDLLFTTDLLVEDTHFRRATHSAGDIGWKALARGLSDIAAMGGEPRFCLVSLSLAPWCDAAWVDGFFRGLLRLAGRTGTVLAGGDLSHGAKLACDVVVGGAVPRGGALRRDGARAGDAIYVSGALGGSALGMAARRGKAWRRHARPEPRLALGRFLRETVGATAAMDLSDGLSLDLARLCAASGLGAEIAAPPVWPGATLAQALHGGEDYELLFTAPPRAPVPAAFQSIPLTRIGVMRRQNPGKVIMAGEPLAPGGYDHFRAR
ncbi:MAG: thiamine-phosphate kinase [Bryobacteraceae bacterium]